MDKETLVEQFTPLLEQFKNDVFALSQALHDNFPLLVEEIYRWEFLSSLLNTVFFAVPVAILGVLLIIKSFPKYGNWGELSQGFIPTAGFLTWLLSIGIFVSNAAWLQIIVAPRLFLVEYVKGLF